ncbi:MAG: DUF3291 domain-containing protein [Rhizobiaceae bacterium]
MPAKCLALYTFGILIEPEDSPANDGFEARNDNNLLAAELSEGFIARSGYDDDPGPLSWGAHAYPRFYKGDDWHSPSTLSLWQDLASAMAFSYSGIHAEAMRHGHEWFVKREWPGYALWWVDGNHQPDWAEAVVRHEHLHDHGPSQYAFTFKQAFDESGMPTSIDRDALRRIIAANEIRQKNLTPTGTPL